MKISLIFLALVIAFQGISHGALTKLVLGMLDDSLKCSTAIACENTFSAKISSTGVVSGENLDWLDGDCSYNGTGTGTCAINSGVFSVAPNCTISGNVSTTPQAYIQPATSATSLVVQALNSSGSGANGPVIVNCQKSGVDYVARVLE